MDAGEKLDVLAEHLGQRMGRRFTPRAGGVGQQVEGGFQVKLLGLTFDGEHEAGHRLVEKLVPGAGPDNAFVVEELFQLVRQLVRAHRAHAIENGLVAGESGVCRHEAGKMVVIQPVEFKAEEDQGRGGVGHAVLRVAHELGAFGVHRVLVVAQARVGHEPPGDHVDAFVFLHASQKARCVLATKLAFVSGGKSGAGTLQFRHVGSVGGRVGGGVEVRQVPVRQVTKAAAGGIGIEKGLWQGQGHEDTPERREGLSRALTPAGATPHGFLIAPPRSTSSSRWRIGEE